MVDAIAPWAQRFAIALSPDTIAIKVVLIVVKVDLIAI